MPVRVAPSIEVPYPDSSLEIGSGSSFQRALTTVLRVDRAAGGFCSAVLVAPQVALTAAHCLPVTAVRAGGKGEGRARGIRQAEVAPEGLDAALIWLSEPMAGAVARVSAGADPPAGEVRMVGFGSTDGAGRREAGERRYGMLWIDGWGCSSARARATGCLPDAELVVPGGGGASDTCDGDSGGPIFERVRDGWRLLGVTSRPTRFGARRCGDGGVYVRADRLARWIDDWVMAWERGAPVNGSPR